MIPYSLYLHIPFCVHRCAYCDFNTYAGLETLIPDYVNALCREIIWAGAGGQAETGRRLPLHSIFFGGGTPSLLPADGLAAILAAVHASFEVLPGAEITLEANPGTVSLPYLQALSDSGINRLSFGMQSAHPDDLRLLERQHGLEDVIQAVRWARQAGFDNLNLDLIFGLPYQSLERWQRTLEMTLGLGPDHLSLYALTFEHGTPMSKWLERGLLAEPDADLAADMYDHATERLAQAGFLQYEISNWAAAGSDGEPRASLHNLQYWRSDPYLGLGAGAHGFVLGTRTVAALAPGVYVRRMAESADQAGAFPRTPATVEARLIPLDEHQGEYMMMGLRLVRAGVSDADFKARFGRSLREAFPKAIARLEREGLLEWAGERLRLTQRARLVGNRVFREFV